MVEQRFRQQEILGHYRLLHLLGRGGFAEVYLGEHIHLQTQAAVKVLRTQLAQEDVQTFQREAQTVARLLHPNIVRVLDFGVENALPYLVMDYAPNGTLRQVCAKGSRVPLIQVVSFTRQIAEALQYAHDRRLIHRDVKPENMLLGHHRETLLSDFGIALVQQSSHLASTQNIAGTIAYMAPEQIQAHPVAASDQYALGVVVYEWLCGVRPFAGSYTEIAVKQTMVPPLPPRTHIPDLSPAVEQVMLQALQKDPRQRFADVRTFAQALEQAAEQRSFSTAAWPPRPDRVPAASPNPQTTGPTSAAFSHQSTALFPSSPHVSLPGPASFAPAQTPPFSPGQSRYSSLSTPMPLSPQGSPPSAQQPSLCTPAPSAYPGGSPPLAPSWSKQPAQRRGLTRRALLIGAGVVGLAAGGTVITDVLFNRARTALLSIPLQGLQTSSSSAQDTPTPILSYAHSGQAVWVARWSPDGKYIATGSLDGLMQIWTADTGATRLSVRSTIQPARSDDYPWSIAWSPQKDGKVAVSFVDGTIQVLDAQTAQRASQFAARIYGVSLLAWSPDERYLAVGGSDSMVHVYTYPAWQVVTLYQGHTDGITSLAWSPDGKTIASGSQDTTVRLWEPLSGHTNLVYTGHSARIGSLCWAPDNTRLVSTATSPDQTARVWQVEGGTTLATYPAPAGAPIGEAMWSHDGRTIAVYGGDAQIHLLDAHTGQDRRRFFSGIVLSLSWSPDDTRIVTGNEGARATDDVARVWQVG
jgi:serine/threonine protein kinase